jgi:metal-sulfur cluster biosynthetic enzyme
MNTQEFQVRRTMNASNDTQMEGTPLIVPSSTDHPLYEPICEACRTVHDPEIPVNIFDLGLIYTIEISDSGAVDVKMSLTAPGCPVAGRCQVGFKMRLNQFLAYNQLMLN